MTRPSLAGIEQRDHAWEVKCPTCGSRPGRPCYGNGAMPRHMTHGARAAVRLKALTAAVRDVLALHADCDRVWPCATRRALATHLDLTDPEGDPT